MAPERGERGEGGLLAYVRELAVKAEAWGYETTLVAVRPTFHNPGLFAKEAAPDDGAQGHRAGEGWEAVGIAPDIEVDPSMAEERALELYEQTKHGGDGFP